MVVNLTLFLAVVGVIVWQLPLPPKVCDLGKWIGLISFAVWIGLRV